MSAARKARRLAKAKGGDFQRALQSVQDTLSQVDPSQLSQLPIIISQLQEQTNRASQLADALTEDYETLLHRIEELERRVGKTEEALQGLLIKFQQEGGPLVLD